MRGQAALWFMGLQDCLEAQGGQGSPLLPSSLQLLPHHRLLSVFWEQVSAHRLGNSPSHLCSGSSVNFPSMSSVNPGCEFPIWRR